jgi:hypothetical protein
MRRADRRRSLRHRRCQLRRHPKIAELELAARTQQQVACLDIAMDHVRLVVQIGERGARSRSYGDQCGLGQTQGRAVLPQLRPQHVDEAPCLTQLDAQVQRPFVVKGAVEGHNVWRDAAAQHIGLACELGAGRRARIRLVQWDGLDGDCRP